MFQTGNNQENGHNESTETNAVCLMGNCSMCNHHYVEDDLVTTTQVDGKDDIDHCKCYINDAYEDRGTLNEDKCTLLLTDIPSSISYPFLQRELAYQFHNNDHTVYDNTDLSERCSQNPSFDTNSFTSHFDKSTSVYSLNSYGKYNSYNSAYRDCRLRYIRQTKKLQKYLRITPEGHLLINNLKYELHRVQNSQTLDGNPDNLLIQNPLSALISTPKLRRIYEAFWSIDSVQNPINTRIACKTHPSTVENNNGNHSSEAGTVKCVEGINSANGHFISQSCD